MQDFPGTQHDIKRSCPIPQVPRLELQFSPSSDMARNIMCILEYRGCHCRSIWTCMLAEDDGPFGSELYTTTYFEEYKSRILEIENLLSQKLPLTFIPNLDIRLVGPEIQQKIHGVCWRGQYWTFTRNSCMEYCVFCPC